MLCAKLFFLNLFYELRGGLKDGLKGQTFRYVESMYKRVAECIDHKWGLCQVSF